MKHDKWSCPKCNNRELVAPQCSVTLWCYDVVIESMGYYHE